VIYEDDNPCVAWASGSHIHLADGYGNMKSTIDVAEIISSDLSFFTQEDNLYLAFITDSGILGIIDTDGNLQQGWPIETGLTTKNSLSIADLNNDGILDILFSTLAGEIIGYTMDGNMLPGFPISNGFHSNSQITIDDFDMDGDFEIILGNSIGILAYDYKVPKGSQTPWPMFRGNMRRTGNYKDNTIVGITPPAEAENMPILLQNAPNPFSTSTKISFNLPLHYADEAKIKIYNIKGQLVRELKIKEEVVWDGRNNAGKSVPNGIYLYRMKADNFTSETKKMILIR
ncbi:MAG: FlgD immunoglobulin-like domain containing protein, partial [Candidatus Cloacimonadia bacterium]